ncbi:hypothetical protein AAG570_002270 [Ranatra chinensis]|uniref:Uncharacterized protein n=1 Tax=Ranatra chinensis TaxID=642074 RepID=A0ABD0Y714_9HEMI
MGSDPECVVKPNFNESEDTVDVRCLVGEDTIASRDRIPDLIQDLEPDLDHPMLSGGDTEIIMTAHITKTPTVFIELPHFTCCVEDNITNLTTSDCCWNLELSLLAQSGHVRYPIYMRQSSFFGVSHKLAPAVAHFLKDYVYLSGFRKGGEHAALAPATPPTNRPSICILKESGAAHLNCSRPLTFPGLFPRAVPILAFQEVVHLFLSTQKKETSRSTNAKRPLARWSEPVSSNRRLQRSYISDMNYDPDGSAEDGDYPKLVRTNEFRGRDDRPRQSFLASLIPYLSFAELHSKYGGPDGVVVSVCDYHAGGPRVRFPKSPVDASGVPRDHGCLLRCAYGSWMKGRPLLSPVGKLSDEGKSLMPVSWNTVVTVEGSHYFHSAQLPGSLLVRYFYDLQVFEGPFAVSHFACRGHCHILVWKRPETATLPDAFSRTLSGSWEADFRSLENTTCREALRASSLALPQGAAFVSSVGGCGILDDRGALGCGIGTERAERSRLHERGTSAERRYKRSHRRSPTSRHHHHHRHQQSRQQSPPSPHHQGRRDRTSRHRSTNRYRRSTSSNSRQDHEYHHLLSPSR